MESEGGDPLSKALTSLVRLAHFASVVARYGLGRAARRGLGWLPGARRRLAAERPGPDRFRRLLQALGGSFVKFGQVLALQPDIVPRRYCDALFDLMDRMPPFDYSQVERILREELGKGPREVFDAFDEIPIASASIAQVHVARLGERKLAVKVQRPEARRQYGGDMAIMAAMARVIRRLRIRTLEWLAQSFEEFVAWTGEELDFRAEARFMAQLADNSRDRDCERVPEVDWSLTTARVLTSEFLEGTTLLQYMRALEGGGAGVPQGLARQGFDPETFAENVLDNFLTDVFRHGLFHADLHPANLLILPGNTVGYVDFGISGVISEHARYHLTGDVMALSRADAVTAAEHLLQICELEPDSDTEQFRRGFADLGEIWFRRLPGRRGFEKTRSYTEILLDGLRLSHACRILPHPEAVRYMRSVITVDGLCSRIAPGMDRDAAIERTCSDLLESSPAAALASYDQWVDWLWAGARLARDGAERLDRALDRLESRVAPGRKRRRGDPGRARRGGAAPETHRSSRRVLYLGVSSLVLALLATAPGEAPALGLNLFTAEIAVLGGALVFLTREVLTWRPSRR